ncbi:MAG: carboxylating nicotinate-nucleotide diphosphorylase [Deltaproteobacteria bacterium]|nr:carboxylating nicotinate-nucleotide diphosphorylase [Deltaproteobacteria bacterium]
MDCEGLDTLIELAIAEDIGSGDITTQAIVVDGMCYADIIAKEELVVCGNDVARKVFARIDESLVYEVLAKDGCLLSSGEKIASVSGKFASVLTAERTVLNFLQRLSGIATATRGVVEKVKGTKVQILDTRKTIPAYRTLEKYAVKTGGGKNHRFGLFDAFLIKNNHIDLLAGDVGLAIRKCRQFAPDKRLEVEVRNLSELEQAIAEAPDAILLDNMSPTEVRRMLEIIDSSVIAGVVEVEVSGGINDGNISEYASLSIDFISLGAITHSARAADISLRCRL